MDKQYKAAVLKVDDMENEGVTKNASILYSLLVCARYQKENNQNFLTMTYDEIIENLTLK